jgi:hypothetical protein
MVDSVPALSGVGEEGNGLEVFSRAITDSVSVSTGTGGGGGAIIIFKKEESVSMRV